MASIAAFDNPKGVQAGSSLRSDIVSRVRSLLKTESQPSIIHEALSLLGAVGDSSDRDLLLHHIRTASAESALDAMSARVRRGQGDTIDESEWLRVLGHDDLLVRRAALRLTSVIANLPPAVVVKTRRLAEHDEDGEVRLWAVRALSRVSAEGSRQPVDWFLDRLVTDSDHRVQIEAIRTLAARETLGAVKLTVGLKQVWEVITSNHYRLTGPQANVMLWGIAALKQHAAIATVKLFAREIFELSNGAEATVTYQPLEAHTVDLIHCAAAELYDLGIGRPEHTAYCGTAKADALTPEWKRARVVRTIAQIDRPVAWKEIVLHRYLDDPDNGVRRMANAALTSPSKGSHPAITFAEELSFSDSFSSDSGWCRTHNPKRRAPPVSTTLPRRALIVTRRGEIVVELLVDEAPFTVDAFVRRTYQKQFDGERFDRLVPNVGVQGGIPPHEASTHTDEAIPCEPTFRPFRRGSIGLASVQRGSFQFFIAVDRQPTSDGRFNQFARVLSGMEIVDRILEQEPISNIYIPNAPSGGILHPSSPQK